MPWCKGTHCSHGQCDTQVQLIDGQIGWVTAFSTTGIIHGKGMNAYCSNITVGKCEATTANLTCNYYAIGLCIKPNVFHKQHLFCCRHPCTLNVITKTDVLSMNLCHSKIWIKSAMIWAPHNFPAVPVHPLQCLPIQSADVYSGASFSAIRFATGRKLFPRRSVNMSIMQRYDSKIVRHDDAYRRRKPTHFIENHL